MDNRLAFMNGKACPQLLSPLALPSHLENTLVLLGP